MDIERRQSANKDLGKAGRERLPLLDTNREMAK